MSITHLITSLVDVNECGGPRADPVVEMDMEEKITTKEAYAAMYAYLKMLYDMTGSDDLGGFLGSMSLLEDGTPSDPGVWDDWLEAVQQARLGQVDLSLAIPDE